jgi:hypothetical protein
MKEAIDYDGGWKEGLEHYFRPFLELCFPTAAAGIAWQAGLEFLDKELEEVVRDANLGKQRADKLVKVQRLDGIAEWILIHVEVQAQRDVDLPLRMYQYHHRIADRYGRAVVSLAVLADGQPDWRPGSYEQSLWGCRLVFEYPVCKLLDFGPQAEELEESDNPAAVLIAAHLAAQSTGGDMEARHRLKWKLTRRLYERGYAKQDVLELFRLIDWFLVLPEERTVAFRRDLLKYEQEKSMPYVTSIERLGRQEGRQEEAANLMVRLARKRFAGFAPEDEAAIRQLPLAALERLGDALLDLASLADLRAWLTACK